MLQTGIGSGLGRLKGFMGVSEDPPRDSSQWAEVATDNSWQTPSSIIPMNVFESQIC